MESKKTIDANKIHLTKIEPQEFDINTLKFKNAKDYNLGIGHRLFHNLDENRLKLDLNCSLHDNDEEKLVNLNIDFHFHIENLKDFYTLNDNGLPMFDTALIATLLGIALSTTRGVLFEKLSTQGISDIIIPVFSPMKMLQSKLTN